MNPIQLNPTLHVITPFGSATALFIWPDEQEVYWGCGQDDTGEIWWWENRYIRFKPSITDGHVSITPIKVDPKTETGLTVHRKRYEKKADEVHD